MPQLRQSRLALEYLPGLQEVSIFSCCVEVLFADSGVCRLGIRTSVFCSPECFKANCQSPRLCAALGAF